jgi:hypothetical protein
MCAVNVSGDVYLFDSLIMADLFALLVGGKVTRV